MRDGIVIFDGCTELDRDQDELYVDAFLRRLNQAANVTGRDSIIYLGYQRALQLYSNEKAFDLTPLQRLKLHQCTNLEMNRSVARKAGYNPEAGRSAPWAGVYFSKGFILTYPSPIKTFLEQPDTGQLVPYGYSGKQEDLTTSPDFIEPMRLTYPNELQLVPFNYLMEQQDLITCSPIKLRSDLPAGTAILPSTYNRPKTPRGMSGSRVPTAGNFASTCVGGMEMAVVMTELLERVVKGDVNDEWKTTVKETLDYIGGSENMYAFLDIMYKQFPQQEDTSLASTVGCRLPPAWLKLK